MPPGCRRLTCLRSQMHHGWVPPSESQRQPRHGPPGDARRGPLPPALGNGRTSVLGSRFCHAFRGCVGTGSTMAHNYLHLHLHLHPSWQTYAWQPEYVSVAASPSHHTAVRDTLATLHRALARLAEHIHWQTRAFIRIRSGGADGPRWPNVVVDAEVPSHIPSCIHTYIHTLNQSCIRPAYLSLFIRLMRVLYSNVLYARMIRWNARTDCFLQGAPLATPHSAWPCQQLFSTCHGPVAQ